MKSNDENKTLDVYFALWTENSDAEIYFPVERRKEIDAVTNADLKRSKITAWKLLSVATEKSLNKPIDDIKFSKTENGKWTAEDFYFSITHTNGFTAVVVSNSACGIDAENIDAFEKKCAYKPFIEAFSQKIGVAKNTEISGVELLKIWTAKESVFKANGKGAFIPKRVNVNDLPVKHYDIEGYLVSLANDFQTLPSFFILNRDGSVLKREILCL